LQGGILLVTSAFSMLNPNKKEFSQELENIAIVPLAFPLTAGPGTIMAVILLVSEASSLLEAFLVFAGIFAGLVVSYLGMTSRHNEAHVGNCAGYSRAIYNQWNC